MLCVFKVFVGQSLVYLYLYRKIFISILGACSLGFDMKKCEAGDLDMFHHKAAVR